MTTYFGAKHWRPAVLEDLVLLQRGFDITKAQQRAGNVPVFSSAGASSWHDTAKVTGPGVIIGRKGTLGSVHYSERDYWPHDTTLWSKSLQGNNPRFVYFALKCLGLDRFNTGGANPTLNRNHIRGLPIKVPEPHVQDQIANILSAYDDLIENNRRRIALLEEVARLLYREWFVGFRFPGHEHVRIVDGVPEGWCPRPLGEIAAANGESYRKGSLPDEINYIDISSVARGRVTSKRRLAANRAPGRARRRVSDGDIIWSNVRPNLRAYALLLEPDEADVASTGFTVLSATGVPYTWLYSAVTTETFVGHLVNHATGVGYPAVRADDFERARLAVPPQDTPYPVS